MIRLALTDLDDTLIAFGRPRASDRALAAIHGMLDAGLHFGPVSGRLPAAMGWMFGGDEACCATGAYCNGQMVYLDGEPISVTSLDGGELDRVAAWLTQNTDDTVLAVFDVQGGSGVDGDAICVTTDAQRLGRMGDEFGCAGIVPRLGASSYVKSNIRCGGSPERRLELRDALKGEFPAFDFVFPSNWAPLIDITPKGWTKGSGVRVLADALGIGLDEVATFGDSENDLGMIAGFPNSVAVANASDEVREAARWHIGPSSEDSVADALVDIAVAAGEGGMPRFMAGA